MRITIFRRLRKDRRGVSNIIVVALSLVIMLAIVSDIVLWNYEMNQADWEKMKEDIKITNVEHANANSIWIVTQGEFSTNVGSLTGGSYVDTQVIDGTYESFLEGINVGPSNITLIDNESFEGSWLPTGWSEDPNNNRWNKENDHQVVGSYSADFDGQSTGRSGDLISPVLDCSDASTIYVEFWWYDDNLDNNEFVLEYYDGSTWNSYQDLTDLTSGNGWYHYTDTITDSQYFVSDFQVKWSANDIEGDETACVDLVTVIKRANSNQYSLDLTGQFNINLVTHSLESIQTVEVQLVYRADDTTENWYLNAYNWASSTYGDSGFNVTSGSTPTTGWDYYIINFSDVWQNYVHSNGTINIKFIDQGNDMDQTSIDIDFLGINVKTDGTQFTLKNEGSLTVRLVSLWITNSTEHRRYDIDVFLNSGATKNYMSYDVELPQGNYIVKVVTERGNTAVFSGS